MDALYGFLKTILDFLVQIALIVISMFMYILQFIADLIRSLASSV